MNVDNLKYVVGKVKENEPAIIRFFGSVDEYNTTCFNDEFLWLQDCVKPSKIIVMINSEGGSVLYGMSTFSIIQSCPIEVDCIIEGIAASMGSVIWAAGDNLFMHDYSLLMIHNPFNYAADDNDPKVQQMVNAFKAQLMTIYQKRFGMTKEQVESIMNGGDGEDGTFFTAKEAVKAGFISSDHVIKTSKQVCDKVKNETEIKNDATSLREFMSSIAAEIDENKLLEGIAAIHNRDVKPIVQEEKAMEKNENQNFDAISAQLGFSKDAQMTAISARIANLIKAETDLKDIQAKYTALEIKYKGKETEVANMKSELDEVKAKLKGYQDAEKAAFEAEVVAMIDAAISAGKIEDSSKDAWMKMAHNDFETVKATLDSIQAREKITETIAKDPTNVSKKEETLKTVEDKMKEDVEAVVGKIELKKF